MCVTPVKMRPLIPLALIAWTTSVVAVAESLPASGGFPYPVTVAREYPPNLLRNGGFEDLDATSGLPVAWEFGNMASSTQVSAGSSQEAHTGGRAAWATSTGDWPGYWVQSVTVVEGVRYYAAVQSKFHMLEGTTGLRVYTGQYADDGSWTNRTSNTDVRSYAEEAQGEGLADFIDPQYLNTIKRGQWNLQDLEFTVPTGKGVSQYDVWAGLYGIGTALVDDVYLGPAAFVLTGSISGDGLTSLRLVNLEGKEYLRQSLPPGASSSSFKVGLPSRLKSYQLEVTDRQGHVWRRAL